MKLAIIQPYFFPYRSYGQFIDAVDRFVIYDEVNYKGLLSNIQQALTKGAVLSMGMKVSAIVITTPTKIIRVMF